jgi:hypothetical protein
LSPRRVLTKAVRGDENLATGGRGNDRESLTMMTTIRATGEKVVLFILGRERT